MGRICAFFGHRDVWEDCSETLERTIRQVITRKNVSVFWVGGYGMFDSCAAGVVKRLKSVYPHITLHIILAYLPTAKETLPSGVDGTIYPEGLELGPKRFAISKRNRWIAQNCDVMITFLNHKYGGAYTACRTARRLGKEIYNLGTLDI